LQHRFDDLLTKRSDETWAKKCQDLESELLITDEQVFTQHEIKFQMTLNRAAYFVHIPLNRPNAFDIKFDVVNGQLVNIYDAPEDPGPTIVNTHSSLVNIPDDIKKILTVFTPSLFDFCLVYF